MQQWEKQVMLYKHKTHGNSYKCVTAKGLTFTVIQHGLESNPGLFKGMLGSKT